MYIPPIPKAEYLPFVIEFIKASCVCIYHILCLIIIIHPTRHNFIKERHAGTKKMSVSTFGTFIKLMNVQCTRHESHRGTEGGVWGGEGGGLLLDSGWRSNSLL